jgi:hypothetical protein
MNQPDPQHQRRSQRVLKNVEVAKADMGGGAANRKEAIENVSESDDWYRACQIELLTAGCHRIISE